MFALYSVWHSHINTDWCDALSFNRTIISFRLHFNRCTLYKMFRRLCLCPSPLLSFSPLDSLFRFLFAEPSVNVNMSYSAESFHLFTVRRNNQFQRKTYETIKAFFHLVFFSSPSWFGFRFYSMHSGILHFSTAIRTHFILCIWCRPWKPKKSTNGMKDW